MSTGWPIGSADGSSYFSTLLAFGWLGRAAQL